jgi:hypothetical protein
VHDLQPAEGGDPDRHGELQLLGWTQGHPDPRADQSQDIPYRLTCGKGEQTIEEP